jgi:hypothetical protein
MRRINIMMVPQETLRHEKTDKFKEENFEYENEW